MSGLSCPGLVCMQMNVFAVALCFLACSSLLWQGASSELTLTQETGKGRPARLGDEIVYKCTVTSSALLRWVVEPLIPKLDPLKFWPHDKTQEPEKTRGNFKATLIESVQASDGSHNMTSLLTITVAPELREVKPIQCRSTLDYGDNDAEGQVVIGFDSKVLSIPESQLNVIAVLRIINGSVAPGDNKAVEVTGHSDTALGGGIDFDFTQSRYTFTDTKTVHYVSVTIIEDTLNEQMESFQLLASSSDAGVTIDPDRVDVSIINHEPRPEDINECDTNNGGCSHICTNTEGSFRCSCDGGYTLASDGKNCNNINECDSNNGGCSHICTDTVGSLRCSCESGYALASDGRSCNNINECNTNNGGCGHICTDTEGSLRCSCKSGYTLASDGKICSNINECETNNGGCSHICTDSEGSLRCSCKSGHTLDSDGRSCNNVDECDSNNGGCSHICTDTMGSFICSCESGYVLASDGRSCNNVNECNTNNGGCGHICTDTEGSLRCSCRSGYTLASDGRSCNNKGESMTTLAVVITIVLGAAMIGIIIITGEMNSWTIVGVEILVIVLATSIIGIVTGREVSMWTTNGVAVLLILIAAAVLRGSPPIRPAKPDQLLVDVIQTDRACVSWVLTHNTPVEAADRLFLVVMRRYDDVQVKSHTMTLPGTVTSHTVEGLTPGVHYKVTLTAQNSAGEEIVGPEEFSTKSLPPPLPTRPDGLTVDDIQTDRVHVLWLLTHNTPEEAADRLILVINRRCDNVTVESRTVTLPGTATSHTVEDLTPGVHYKVTLTAQNSAGEEIVGPEEFSTKSPPPIPSTPPPVLPLVPPAKQYRLRVDDVRTDQACVSWDYNTPEEDRLTLVVSRCDEVENYTLPRMVTSHTLMDLTPGDHYRVTLTAENLAKDQTDGKGYTEQVQFSTVELFPPLKEVTFTINWKHRAFIWPEKGIAISLNFDNRLSGLLQFVNTYNFKVTIRAYLPNSQQHFPQNSDMASVLYNVVIHNPDGMPGKYFPHGMPTLEAKVSHCSAMGSTYCVFEDAESGTSFPIFLKKHSQSNLCQIEDKEAKVLLESPCSWFALVGDQNRHGCEFSAQFFVRPDGPQKFHIFFTVTKNLPLLLNAFDDMLLEQYSATKVMELPVSFNAEKVSLIVPEEGIVTNGWHITCPKGPLEILRTSASLIPDLEGVPVVKLTAEYENGEDVQPFHYQVQLSGLTSYLKGDLFFIHCTPARPDVNGTAEPPSTSDYDERRRPTLKNLKESGLLQDLSPYWPLVAISLGLGGSICRIRAMYPGNSPNAENTDELCTLEVIARWLQEASEPTWVKMMEMIDSCIQCEMRSDIATLLNTMKSKTENLRVPPLNTTAKPTAVVVTDTDLVSVESTVSREDLDWQLLAVSLRMGHYINHEQALIQPRPCYSSNITQLLRLWCRDKGDSATWKELCSALNIYGADISM